MRKEREVQATPYLRFAPPAGKPPALDGQTSATWSGKMGLRYRNRRTQTHATPFDIGKRPHLRRQKLPAYASCPQVQVAVGNAVEPGYAMLGDQQGEPSPLELQHGLSQLRHARGIHIGSRLIEDEDCRCERVYRGYRHTLLLAAGKRVDRSAPQRLQAHHSQGAISAPSDFHAVHAPVLAGERHFSGKLRGEELAFGILEHASHQTPDLPAPEAFHIAASHQDTPLLLSVVEGGYQRTHHAGYRRLPAAGGAAQHHTLTGSDGEVDVKDAIVAPLVAEGDPLESDHSFEPPSARNAVAVTIQTAIQTQSPRRSGRLW
mgnify:CR=1 FL=1